MYEAPAHAFMPHVEGYAELASITLARKIDDINARHAAETAKSARLTRWALVAALVPILALGVAAVAMQGAENIQNWRVANEPV